MCKKTQLRYYNIMTMLTLLFGLVWNVEYQVRRTLGPYKQGTRVPSKDIQV